MKLSDADGTGNEQVASILVVDDHEPSARLLSAYLDSHGYRTAVATSTEEALSTISNSAFDLVVSDSRMKGESGLELCARIRAEFGPVPFLLYTVANITEEEVREAQKVGVDIFIHRPSDIRAFLPPIEKLVRKPD